MQCGDGWIVEEAWRRAQRAYVCGLDTSPAQVERARRLRGPRVDRSEDRIDKGRQHGALSEHQQRSDDEHYRDDRQQPPLLPDPHERPEFPRETRMRHTLPPSLE